MNLRKSLALGYCALARNFALVDPPKYLDGARPSAYAIERPVEVFSISFWIPRDAMTKRPLAFISYRRGDTDIAAQAIYAQLKVHFGSGQLFMDVNSIETGENWELRIGAKLNEATGVLALVGPRWLKAVDEWERRRIDCPDDWVARELRTALSQDIPIVPVLIGAKSKVVHRDALPAGLERLFSPQAIRIDPESHWERDTKMLIEVCQSLFRLVEDPALQRGLIGPGDAEKKHAPSVTPDELASFLRTTRGWEPWDDVLPREYPRHRKELRKNFVFSDFEDAMEFMQRAAPRFAAKKHHPRWSNEFALVTIRLSTWDAENKITGIDLSVANEIDEVYAEFLIELERRKRSDRMGANR